MTKFCPFCGEELIDDARFCKSCGKKVETYQSQTAGPANDYSVHPPVVEKKHTLATVLGFICSLLFPLIGLIFGVYLYTRKDNSNSKRYGTLMIVISIIVWIFSAGTLLIGH